jgi:hypothetical protein
MEIQKINDMRNPYAINKIPHDSAYHQSECYAVYAPVTEDFLAADEKHDQDSYREQPQSSVTVLENSPCRSRVAHVVQIQESGNDWF